MKKARACVIIIRNSYRGAQVFQTSGKGIQKVYQKGLLQKVSDLYTVRQDLSRTGQIEKHHVARLCQAKSDSQGGKLASFTYKARKGVPSFTKGETAAVKGKPRVFGTPHRVLRFSGQRAKHRQKTRPAFESTTAGPTPQK
jgi:hypothetical protein